ncbi:MAG: terpene cyclase/mutase family protein [Candidatus Marinimicrobia bacterium]|nr:terpene cyclase/mutase family protein [Candidatus Neomarinimicrobiota bacterium]
MVDLEPGWSRVLAAPAIPAVFEQGPAGARLLMLELLVSEWTPQLASFRRELRWDARHGQMIRRTLREQLEDGSWPVKAPREPVGAYRQMVLVVLVEKLHTLMRLGGRRSWPEARQAIRALLGFQQPDGRFPLMYHHHAAIGSLMISLGLGRNPAVHKAAHWILERQREDGGWLHPHMAGSGKRTRSCLWTTAEVLAFLGRYPTMRVKEKLQAAGEFLLKHALEANTTSLLPGADAWNFLQTGSRGVQLFQGGTLKVLDGLSLAGFNPAQRTFKKLYEWLLNQQLPGGLLPRVAERDEKGDAVVTVRALDVIRRVEIGRPTHLAGEAPTA